MNEIRFEIPFDLFERIRLLRTEWKTKEKIPLNEEERASLMLQINLAKLPADSESQLCDIINIYRSFSEFGLTVRPFSEVKEELSLLKDRLIVALFSLKELDSECLELIKRGAWKSGRADFDTENHRTQSIALIQDIAFSTNLALEDMELKRGNKRIEANYCLAVLVHDFYLEHGYKLSFSKNTRFIGLLIGLYQIATGSSSAPKFDEICSALKLKN